MSWAFYNTRLHPHLEKIWKAPQITPVLNSCQIRGYLRPN
jgi:hypothetical protein